VNQCRSTAAEVVKLIASEVTSARREAGFTEIEECTNQYCLDGEADHPVSVNNGSIRFNYCSLHEENQAKECTCLLLLEEKDTEIPQSEELTTHSELTTEKSTLPSVVMPLKNATNLSLDDECEKNASQTPYRLRTSSDYEGASGTRIVTTVQNTFQAKTQINITNKLPVSAGETKICPVHVGSLTCQNAPSMREINILQTNKNGETIDLSTLVLPQNKSEISILREYSPMMSVLENVDLGKHINAQIDSGYSQTNNAMAIVNLPSCSVIHEDATENLKHAIEYDVQDLGSVIPVSSCGSSCAVQLSQVTNTAMHETGSSKLETHQRKTSQSNDSVTTGLECDVRSQPNSMLLTKSVCTLADECQANGGQFAITNSYFTELGERTAKDSNLFDFTPSYPCDVGDRQPQQLGKNSEIVCADFRNEESVTVADYCLSGNDYVSTSNKFFQAAKVQTAQAANEDCLLPSLNDESQSFSSKDSNLNCSHIMSTESSLLDSIPCKCEDVANQGCSRRASAASRPKTKRPLFSCKGLLMPCHVDQADELSNLMQNEVSTFKTEALPAMLQGVMMNPSSRQFFGIL
jgi:hypothetical protein